MRHVTIALLLAAIPATALQAQAMPVSTFLAKADALKKRGPLALLSGDLGLLKREIQNSAKQLKVEREAATKAGRQPTYCPPAKGSMSSDEILKHFQAIPPGQRNVPVKAAFHSFLRKKYPCRA